ncbi:MAG: hypothetical protein WHV61_11625 [Burkholderiales bacterium]
MKTRQGVLAALLLAGACAAQANDYSGRLDLVEVKADGARFLAQREKLNLYASGAYRDVLLAGFFHQARLRVDYTPFPCGGGVTGICGTVHGVRVESTDLR